MSSVPNQKEKPTWLTLPNFLTAFRLILIPYFLYQLIQGMMLKALLIFLLAGLTDLLDGFVARTWNVRTPLGRILDPAADKLLLVSAFIISSLPRFSHPFSTPSWLVATVIARDSLIALGALTLFTWKGVKIFMPSIWGKISTFLQVVTVLLVLTANAVAQDSRISLGFIQALVSPQIQSPFFILTFLATVISGLHYTAIGLKKVLFSS